jgi:hypothetical protein
VEGGTVNGRILTRGAALVALLCASAGLAIDFGPVARIRTRMAAAVAVDPVWDGLVGYYALDGNAYDEVRGETGTWGADVVATNAVPFGGAGTAASLNRAANAFVTTVTSVHSNKAVTLSAWVFLRAKHDYGGIVNSYTSSSDYLGMSQNNSTNQVRFDVIGGNARAVVGTTGGLGQWFHMAATVEIDYEQADRSAPRLYINGNIVGTSDLVAGSKPLQASDVFKIGFDDSTSARKTDGIIDEVAIWARALSSNEIHRIATEQLIYRRP